MTRTPRQTRTQRLLHVYRTGPACIEVRDAAGRPCAGVPVWAEQETHAFVFGCVAPELSALADADRQRRADRLTEVFNRIVPADHSPEPGATRVDVPDAVGLGWLRLELDRLSSAGQTLEVYVRGRSVAAGLSERAAAERVVAFYTLCFAHPGVRAIVWEGFWDGEERADGVGLLRLDWAPRPAFRYLDKLIGTVWHTRSSGATDADGRHCFRGFFGDYRAAAQVGATTTAGQFSHRGGAGASIFRLQVPA